MSTNTNVVVVERSENAPLGFVGVFVILGLICVVVTYFWQIVIFAGLVFVGFVIWLLFRDQQLRNKELSARADEQNRMYLEGDQRGVFGYEGPQR